MDTFKLALAVVLGMLASFAKQYGVIILLVAAVVTIDFVTGLVKAKVTGEKWESRKGTVGFWKKISYLCGLFFGIFLDFFIPIALQAGLDITMPFNTPFGLIIGVYITLNECISICENLYQCNEKIIPKWLVGLLKIASSQIEPESERSERSESEEQQ